MERFALILTPTEELFKWLNELFPNDPMEPYKIGDHDSADVFLIDEFEDFSESEVWLKENYMLFFEEVLTGWCENEDRWPKDLSWEKFSKFVHYSIQSIVYDISSLSDSPDLKDEPME